MQAFIKKTGKHLIAAALFLALVWIFFAPAVFDGKVIIQGDNIKAAGMGPSQLSKYAATAEPGEVSLWSDAMFGGMPYGPGYGKVAPTLPSFSMIDSLLKQPGYTHSAMVFTGLICFYIFLCVLGVNWWLAVCGAIAFAFASYNIIIIEAGHIVKAYVIAYMPITLAGMALLFRKKYLKGGVTFLLGVAFSLFNGHIQITYYLALLGIFVYIGHSIHSLLREKMYTEWAKATGIMIIAVILAVLPNAAHMYSDWDLGQHSIRGASELTPKPDENGNVEKASTGLDKTYAFQWSYGCKELLTVMIPNAYGGGSGGTLGSSSNLVQALKAHNAQVGNEVQSYTYWGDKAFTSGPVYFGALVCFMFILGMFVVRNGIKWWLAAGGAFMTFLALGRNFDAFNDLMFHHLPLYNKFRTVEMALVIPGMIFPIIGIWGLSEVLQRKVEAARLKKAMIWSYAITAGVCLIVLLVPTLLLDFRSPFDEAHLQGFPDWYVNALLADRQALASNDALRSLVIISIGAGALLLYNSKMKNMKNAATLVSILFTVVILIDLWTVDRRFVNDASYTKETPAQSYKAGKADDIIRQDPDPSFRVLGLSNPWQNTDVSYFHHSIGGYHAVKLRRYNELIEHRLDKEYAAIINTLRTAKSISDIDSVMALSPSLSMLNMKYVIYDPAQPPLRNANAYGNCWFVHELLTVDNADEEIAALDRIDPRRTAVVDRRFSADVAGLTLQADPDAVITLEKYRPSKLTYKSKAATEQLAVFSEIYYNPGWRVSIDGNPASHFRVDWILRGMRVPAGEHTIVFEFHPDTYIVAANVSAFSSFVILLLILAAAVQIILKNKAAFLPKK